MTNSVYIYADGGPEHTHSYLLGPVKSQLTTPQRILDIGCGTGHIADALQKSGHTVSGIDSSPNAVDLARQQFKNIDFRQCGIESEPPQEWLNAFDTVIAVEVVEHLMYPGQLLVYANKVLKPGGKIILTTPYHGYLKNLLLSILNKWDFHHCPLWDGGHVKFWSKNTLSQLMTNNHFTPVQFEGAGRLPLLWKSMVLTGTKSCKS